MNGALEVGDIVRRHRSEYQQRYPQAKTPDQARVLDAIEQCRTRALGGHIAQCGDCGHERNAYNSCKNRHCPKCQNGARQRWLKARMAELLPVPYYHVVFTVPRCVAELALQNRRVVYGILFQAASRALLRLGRDPRLLGGEMGVLAVLHTWGQNLSHHPHLHCIVPAGGLDSERKWRKCRSQKILLPVRVLSRLFRGIFLSLLRRAHLRGELKFHGSLQDYASFEGFCCCLKEAKRTEWVVYSKRPFGGAEQVLNYLGRYTHKVAISNQRLIDSDGSAVRFRWKDYRTGQQNLVLELDGIEFLRRFLLHTLPKGFMRIRSFGFLANRRRSNNLKACRDSLKMKAPQNPGPDRGRDKAESKPLAPWHCAHCQGQEWLLVETIPRPLRKSDSS